MSLVKKASKEMKSIAEQLKAQLGPEAKINQKMTKVEKVKDKLKPIVEHAKNLSPTHKAALGIAGAGLLAAVVAGHKHKKDKKK